MLLSKACAILCRLLSHGAHNVFAGAAAAIARVHTALHVCTAHDITRELAAAFLSWHSAACTLCCCLSYMPTGKVARNCNSKRSAMNVAVRKEIFACIYDVANDHIKEGHGDKKDSLRHDAMRAGLRTVLEAQQSTAASPGTSADKRMPFSALAKGWLDRMCTYQQSILANDDYHGPLNVLPSMKSKPKLSVTQVLGCDATELEDDLNDVSVSCRMLLLAAAITLLLFCTDWYRVHACCTSVGIPLLHILQACACA